MTDSQEEVRPGGLVEKTVLGLNYFYGNGVALDYEKALKLLSEPAQRGIPRACFHLGLIYANGLGVPKDEQKAFALYERAALREEFFAQIELARMYARGIPTIPRDTAAAAKWYRAALAQTDVAEDEEQIEAREFLAKHASGG